MGGLGGGSGDFVNVSGDGNGEGYDFTTGGVNFGLDYRLGKELAVGIAAGYAHTSTSLVGDGSIDVNSGKAAVYATFYRGGFYLNDYLGGGYSSYNTRREVFSENAVGNTNGWEFDAYAAGGYEFYYRGWTFGPIGSLQYTDVDFNNFSENGTLAPLKIDSKSEDLRTNIGLSASYTWGLGKILVTPNLRATWQHEYLYSALPVNAQFASGAGGVFTVHGPSVGQDSALLNAGVQVQWTPTSELT